MLKKLIVGGLVLAGVAAFVKSRMGGGYEEDDFDTEDFGPAGGSGATAEPQQDTQTSTPGHGTTASVATMSRAETAADAIRVAWPGISNDEITSAEDDTDRLAALIAEKTGEPQGSVRPRLAAIIEESGRSQGSSVH